MSLKFHIFVDDERSLIRENVPAGFFPIVCRDYPSAINALEVCQWQGAQVSIDLDHDLGLGKTGYDVCKYIVENQYPLKFYSIHTMNPVGRKNMIQLMEHYGYMRY